jgi:hypothetical protein
LRKMLLRAMLPGAKPPEKRIRLMWPMRTRQALPSGVCSGPRGTGIPAEVVGTPLGNLANDQTRIA